MNSLLQVMAVVLIAAVKPQTAEKYDLNRYQVIIDKSPFGSVTGPAGAPPSFAARFSLVGFVYSNSVVPQVILQDKEGNRWHFKAENEMIDDVKVASIDITARKAVIQKGLEKATLTVEQKPTTPGPAVPTAQPAPMPIPGVPGQPGTAPGPTPRRIPFRRGN